MEFVAAGRRGYFASWRLERKEEHDRPPLKTEPVQGRTSARTKSDRTRCCEQQSLAKRRVAAAERRHCSTRMKISPLRALVFSKDCIPSCPHGADANRQWRTQRERAGPTHSLKAPAHRARQAGICFGQKLPCGTTAQKRAAPTSTKADLAVAPSFTEAWF